MGLPLDPVTTDEMFPDTLVEPFVLSSDVADIASDVIEHWDEFRALRDAIESEVNPLSIAYVLDTKKFEMTEEDWTVHTVVNVTKASPLWRSLSSYHAVIAYRQAFWDAQDDGARRAFLHHGLSHIDALGSKVAIRPHPVEGFPWTFRRYGPLSLNDKMFFRAGSLWNEDHPEEPVQLRALDAPESGGLRSITVSTGDRSVTIDAAAAKRIIKNIDAAAAKRRKAAGDVDGESCPFPDCTLSADHIGQHRFGDGESES